MQQLQTNLSLISCYHIDIRDVNVILFFFSQNCALQCFEVRYPDLETLTSNDRDLVFGNVQPTSMHRRLHEFESRCKRIDFFLGKPLVQAVDCMYIQVIKHERYLFLH